MSSIRKEDVLCTEDFKKNSISTSLWTESIAEDSCSLEEEACCRICFMEMKKGEAFRMDCLCKGELAQLHRECAAKWFTVYGRASCDICGHRIDNLSHLLEMNEWDLLAWRDSDFHLDDSYQVSSWKERVAVFLSGAIALIWSKIEELSEFP